MKEAHLKGIAAVFLALPAVSAHAASPRATSIEFKQGAGCATNALPCTIRTLPVPPSYARAVSVTEAPPVNGVRRFNFGNQFVQFTEADGPVSSRWVYTVTTCPPPHPIETQPGQCPAGTSGSWTQTRIYTMGPPPACIETNSGWVPTSPPAGACVTDPPPPPGGSLNIDFSFIDRNSAAYTAFINFANRTDEADPQTLAWAYKAINIGSYCTRAVPQVDAWMQHPEDFADDSYLQIDQYLAPAMMVRDWCPTVTSAQRADWLTKAKATVDAVWAQGCPGWGVCDLQNNYHAHFVRATVYTALASGDPSRIAFALGKLNEQLAALNASQPNGGSLEGKGYQYAWKWLNDSALVVRDSGYGDVFNSNGYLSANTLEWVHATTPDMAHFAPIGSQPRDSSGAFYDYQRGSVGEGCYLTTNAAVKQAAGYLLANLDLQTVYRANSWDNMWRCPSVPAPPALVYNAKGIAIYGRTAWRENAKYLVTVAYDRSQSHAHSEFGEIMYWLSGGWGVVAGQSLSHSGINGEPPAWSTRAKNVVGIFATSGAARDAECRSVRAFKAAPAPAATSVKAKELAAKAAELVARDQAARARACNTPNAVVEIRPVEGFPVLSDYTENQATGDHSFCLDSTANYPSSVSLLKRCVAFVGGVVTVTDSVRLTGATSAKQQWIVPGNSAACTSTVCTAGSLRITPADSVPMQAAIVPLSSFDSDFDRGGQRISRDCSTGCTTKLGP